MTRLGFQIPLFTYPGVAPDEQFDRIADIAGTAERAGADTVFVMDHFFQLPMLGPPELDMFEAYTLLGGLAARTESARLGTLVTGVTYRNPAVLAKCVTAVDVISKGRALLGIGAAWFDVEHEALDVPFPPVKERMERLEDALRICRAMFTQRQSTVEGTHHRVTDAWNVPQPVRPGGPPIMVGGQGEKVTFRLAAQYADELNMNASFPDVPRKLDALGAHLERFGRDRSSISVSVLATAVVGRTHDEAEAKLAGMLRERGVNPDDVLGDPGARADLLSRFLAGDPDEVGEQIAALLDAGLDGVAVNMVTDAGDLDAVDLTVRTLDAALPPAV